VRRHQVKRWIACRLEYKGWHRAPLMQPGRFTELFFLDEATAFAAGHRPCALCRRDDYERVRVALGESGADALDARLHAERHEAHRGRTLAGLPDGAFLLHDGEPWLLRADRLLRWTPGKYSDARAVPRRGLVITPPSLLEVLGHGWRGAVPLVHPSAEAV